MWSSCSKVCCVPEDVCFQTVLLSTAKKFFSDKNKYFLRRLWCNCNYILFNKLPYSRESERTIGFRVKLPHAHLSTTQGGDFAVYTVTLIAERQTGK